MKRMDRRISNDIETNLVDAFSATLGMSEACDKSTMTISEIEDELAGLLAMVPCE